MEVVGRCARKQYARGADSYDMDYFTFSLKTESLPPDLVSAVRPVDVWRIMQYIVQRELISVEMQSGHMSLEYAKERLDHLQLCLGPELAALVTLHGC